MSLSITPLSIKEESEASAWVRRRAVWWRYLSAVPLQDALDGASLSLPLAKPRPARDPIHDCVHDPGELISTAVNVLRMNSSKTQIMAPRSPNPLSFQWLTQSRPLVPGCSHAILNCRSRRATAELFSSQETSQDDRRRVLLFSFNF